MSSPAFGWGKRGLPYAPASSFTGWSKSLLNGLIFPLGLCCFCPRGKFQFPCRDKGSCEPRRQRPWMAAVFGARASHAPQNNRCLWLSSPLGINKGLGSPRGGNFKRNTRFFSKNSPFSFHVFSKNPHFSFHIFSKNPPFSFHVFSKKTPFSFHIFSKNPLFFLFHIFSKNPPFLFHIFSKNPPFLFHPHTLKQPSTTTTKAMACLKIKSRWEMSLTKWKLQLSQAQVIKKRGQILLWKSIFLTKSFMHIKSHVQGVFCVQALIIPSRNSKPIALTSSKFLPVVGYPGKVRSRDGILQTLSFKVGFSSPGHPSSLTSIPASFHSCLAQNLSSPTKLLPHPWELKILKFPF